MMMMTMMEETLMMKAKTKKTKTIRKGKERLVKVTQLVTRKMDLELKGMTSTSPMILTRRRTVTTSRTAKMTRLSSCRTGSKLENVNGDAKFCKTANDSGKLTTMFENQICKTVNASEKLTR